MKKQYLIVLVLLTSVFFKSNLYAQCPYPTPIVNVVNGVICNGSPAILSVPDIYDSYQWFWGNVPVPTAATDYSYWAVVQGNYYLQIVLNGCTTLTAPVFVSAPLVQPLNFADTLYSCTNDLTIQLDVNLYDSFQWSSGQTTSAITITQSGWVGVGVGINALSCGVADTFWVELNKPSPTVTIDTIGNNPFCLNSSLILESSNANGYTWSTGETSQSIIVTTPGLYTVTVENYFGCTATASIQANAIPCIPTTQLSGSFCPNYNLVQTSALICALVPSATQYQWRFRQNGNVYANKLTSTNYTVLHNVSPQISFGNIYQVDVRVMVGGQWGAYGSVCEIGLVVQPVVATVPLTQLRPQDCGKLNYRLNNDNRLVTNPVYMASGFEFQFSNALTGVVVATKITQFGVCFLNTVTPTLLQPAQYNVRVKVFYGGVWGNYGNACLIGIIGVNKDDETMIDDLPISPVEEDAYFFDAGSYPNPFQNNATLSIISSNNEQMKVVVFDVTGKIVDEFSAQANQNMIFGEAYTKGLYFLQIVSASGVRKNYKVIKE